MCRCPGGKMKRFHTVLLLALVAGVLTSSLPSLAAANERPDGPLVPESGTLLGAWTDAGGSYTDAEVRAAVEEHEDKIGRGLDIAHDFNTFDSAINVSRLRWYHETGRIPMATWNGAPPDDILSGANDDWIRAQAERFKAVEYPVFLRFFHEVDSTKGANWGYEANPEKFEEVWRYVRTIFASVGANNVVWVYSPTAWGFETGEAELYYPGDDVVDWVGADGYLWIPCRPDAYESFASVYEAAFEFALDHDKPLMAAEWGAGGSGDDSHKADFYASVVEAAEQNPVLAAIVYFDTVGPEGCDWRIDTTPTSLEAYRAMANDPVFFPDTTELPPPPPPPSTLPAFLDIAGSEFRGDIIWLAGRNITKGCNPPANDRFCPDNPVTRGQLATFLTKGLDIDPSNVDLFFDDDSSVHEANINAAAAAGVIKGYGAGRVGPNDLVTRGQMAAMLTRALTLDATTSGSFNDTRNHIFEDDIEALVAAGITSGCNPPVNDRFCPEAVVTRGQFAAFLHRALG